LSVRARSNTVTETGIAFFSAGGHSHDGINSSIIDTTKYSIFDFNFGLISTNSARINNQTKNEKAFRDFIMKVINQSVLEPAGVVLQDNIINARNIIAGSITADEIAANTITANNIAAGTIVADLISAGTITGDLIAANTITANNITANTITANEIAANSITALEIATNTITASEIAAGAITSELLQANIIIGNNATFTGIVSAATITASLFSTAPDGSVSSIQLVPSGFSETSAVHSLRFFSLLNENYNNSPSIRADTGVLQISGSGARAAGGRLNFGSVSDGVHLTGSGAYMVSDANPSSIERINNKGYFRNISFGATKPESRQTGDIHFSL
jgi:hypothetical protein